MFLDPMVGRVAMTRTIRPTNTGRLAAAFTTSVASAARPLFRRSEPLAALLLLVGMSPLRRRALPAARLARPSGAPNHRI